MPINDGGPAFPLAESRGPNGELWRMESFGMSLLDYFAAKAAEALLANPVASAAIARDAGNTGRLFVQEVALVACDLAEALIEERARRMRGVG